MKQQLNEIKRMQQLAGILNENQASKQGHWDTESTLEHLKKELEKYNIKFDISSYSEDNQRNIILYGTDIYTIVIRNGKVIIYEGAGSVVEKKFFDLNEDATLSDIMDYILKLV